MSNVSAMNEYWRAGALCCVMLALASCGPSSDVGKSHREVPHPKPVATVHPPSPPPPTWIYHNERDEMRGSWKRYAVAHSEDEVDFGPPYGRQKVMFVVAWQDTGNLLDKLGRTVAFGVPHGQFVCNEAAGDTISVKLDDGPVEELPCSNSADGVTSWIYVEQTRHSVLWMDIFRKRRMTAELPIYQEGRRQLTFDITGFDPYGSNK